MGIKEDMMEKMMGAMSDEEKQKMMREAMIKMMAEMTSEEKQGMMEEMMKQFFSGITEEDKTNMMGNMMSEMMKGMMDGGMMSHMSDEEKKGGGMRKMMRRCMSEDFEPPWVTMQTIMEEVLETCGFALVNTPELHTLFSEFLDRKGCELLPHLSEFTSLDDLQKKTSLSRESLIYLILQLARKEEIDIKMRKK